MNNPIPIVVLAGLVSGVAAAVVVTLLTPRASPVPVPATGEPVDLTPILDRLDDIERTMAQQRTDRAPIEEPEVDVELPVTTEGGVAAVPSTARGVLPRDWPQNWNALQSIALLAQTDKDSAMKNVQLLTVSEVIRRFGSPTRVMGGNGKLSFLYYQVDPGNKLLPGQVRFEFTDGYVTQILTDRR